MAVVPPAPGVPRTALLALAAVLCGIAVQQNAGAFSIPGLLYLTGALVSGLLGAVGPAGHRRPGTDERLAVGVLGLGLMLQFALLYAAPPAMYLRLDGFAEFRVFLVVLAPAAVLAGSLVSPTPWLGRATFPALLLIFFVLGFWILERSPRPLIDVHVVHQEACRALLSGHNPFAVTYPDLYGANSHLYMPGSVVSGRVQLGYPYPPINLLMALPGYAIAGDYRYGALCALIVAAALIAYATPSRASFLAAAVLLFTPRIFFVLEQGWTESFALALLAAVVFVARRAPRWLFVPVGLFLASKQYLPLTAPLLLVLLPRPLRLREVARLFVRAAAVGLVVTLPFILWAPGAFARSALTLHSPFRLDALSFLAWYGHAVGRPGPDWASLLVLTILSAVALWRCPRTVSGYAGGVAVVLLGCFLVARHAFCNHYFLVIGALCAAVASARAEGGVGPAPAAETVAPVSARPPEP